MPHSSINGDVGLDCLSLAPSLYSTGASYDHSKNGAVHPCLTSSVIQYFGAVFLYPFFPQSYGTSPHTVLSVFNLLILTFTALNTGHLPILHSTSTFSTMDSNPAATSH